MPEPRPHLPDFNQLSILTAAVLLAYALAQLVEPQRAALAWNLLGLRVDIPLNLAALSILLAAGLTAAGSNWLLRSHPHFEQASTVQHSILPALTALVIGIPLYNLPLGITWWVTFALGGGLLLVAFITEYIVMDSADTRYPAAAATLIALSYILFFILVASLGFASARLLALTTAILPAAALTSLRALRLRQNRWQPAWAIGIAIICLQIAAALHYWPIRPIPYGLVVTGVLYALTGLALNMGEQIAPRRATLEMGFSLALFGLVAALLQR